VLPLLVAGKEEAGFRFLERGYHHLPRGAAFVVRIQFPSLPAAPGSVRVMGAPCPRLTTADRGAFGHWPVSTLRDLV